MRCALMNKAKVMIFLATYNGEKYLAEQLDSIINQSHTNWELWVSDDGSIDATVTILQQYQQKLGAHKMHILAGPQKGYALNFLSLVHRCSAKADYYAFSDQDDIWLKDKLKVAIEKLNCMPSDKPTLYCSGSIIVDAKGSFICQWSNLRKKLCFQNALVECLASGNTMVFNNPTKEIMTQRIPLALISHDWWAYMLVTGVGGEIFYDTVSHIKYRQHESNVIGYKMDLKTRMYRFMMLICGRVKEYNNVNLIALIQIADLLTEKNRGILYQFIAARKAWFIHRMLEIKRIGIYRQTLIGNATLTIAALLKKL